jgi:hypothetical protein
MYSQLHSQRREGTMRSGLLFSILTLLKKVAPEDSTRKNAFSGVCSSAKQSWSFWDFSSSISRVKKKT